MIDRSHCIASENLIRRLGTNVEIKTIYVTKIKANIDDIVIYLTDTYGLSPENTLYYNSIELTIVDVLEDYILISEPLESSIPVNSQLSAEVITYGLLAPIGRNISRDLIEFNKRVRIPKDTLVNYGSKVSYIAKDYYVTGLDRRDTSLSLKLRSIDGLVTIQRLTQGDYNGFDYAEEWSDIYPDVEAYFEHISSKTVIAEAGYVPSTYQLITMPDTNIVLNGDRIVRGSDNFRVIGLDRFRIKNLLTVVVDLDVAR